MDSDYNIKSYNSNETTTNKALQFSRNPWGAPAAKAMFDFEWQRSLQRVAWIDQPAIHTIAIHKIHEHLWKFIRNQL